MCEDKTQGMSRPGAAVSRSGRGGWDRAGGQRRWRRAARGAAMGRASSGFRPSPASPAWFAPSKGTPGPPSPGVPEPQTLPVPPLRGGCVPWCLGSGRGPQLPAEGRILTRRWASQAGLRWGRSTLEMQSFPVLPHGRAAPAPAGWLVSPLGAVTLLPRGRGARALGTWPRAGRNVLTTPIWTGILLF